MEVLTEFIESTVPARIAASARHVLSSAES